MKWLKSELNIEAKGYPCDKCKEVPNKLVLKDEKLFCEHCADDEV